MSWDGAAAVSSTLKFHITLFSNQFVDHFYVIILSSWEVKIQGHSICFLMSCLLLKLFQKINKTLCMVWTIVNGIVIDWTGSL